MRMDQKESLNYFGSKSQNGRKVGEPKLRWPEDEKKDLRYVKVKRWWQKQIIGKNMHLS
jgi:hypothetical protein